MEKMVYDHSDELQMWEDLVQKAKNGGLDVIDTYVFWNIHEPSPGNVCVLDPHFRLLLLLSSYLY